MKLTIRLFFVIVFVCTQTLLAQVPTSGFIGYNHWLTNLDNVWSQMKTMKPKIIRIGGIQPNEQYYGTAYYDKTLDNIAAAGAVPLVQISDQWSETNVRALLANFVAKGRKIDYFAIGNEPDHRGESVENVILYYKRVAPIIRSYYPNCTLVGPAFANFYEGYITGAYTTFLNAVAGIKDANGRYILDVFDFHIYNSAYDSQGKAIFDLATVRSRMNILLPKLDAINTTRPANQKLGWAVTEFHITYNNDYIQIGNNEIAVPTSHKTYNFYAGQYFAQMYGFGIEKKAFAFTAWSIYEQDGKRTAIDLGIFDTSPTYYPRSTYYHSKMLLDNLRTTAIAHTENKTDVEVVALKDNTGTTVMVMNTQANSYDLTLKLDKTITSTTGLVINVDAAFTNIQYTDKISATSTKVFVFNTSGQLTKTISYSAADAAIHKAPTEALISNTNSAPLVSITAPLLNSVYTAPASIALEAKATDADGSVAKVEFITGTTVLATLTASPYAFNWSDVAAGTYSISARATDNKGAVTTSTPVIVTVNAAVIPPMVAFTVPKNNDSFTEGYTLSVNVDAQASTNSGAIQNVVLYLDGVLVRQENIAPYDWADAVLQTLAVGKHTLKAVATSSSGLTSESSVSITVVAANVAPTISIITSAASYTAPASVDISATAADVDGTISKVEFYNGAVLLSTDITAPYAFSWTNVAVGSYNIMAKVTDDDGAATISAPLVVEVKAVVPPTITFTKPLSGSTFTEGYDLSVNVEALASNTSGTISNVKLYLDEVLVRQENIAPYDWADAALKTLTPGAHVLKAVVTTSSNLIAESSISITIVAANVVPTASISAPATTLFAPATIALLATAADADGDITKLEILNGASILATGITSPLSYSWTNVAAGTYTLTTRATDNKGAVTISAPMNVVVNAIQPPTISFISPLNNESFTQGFGLSVHVDAVKSSSSGDIQNVVLYLDGILVRQENLAPFDWYDAVLKSLPVGTHILKAVTTSAMGVTAEVSISIKITAAVAPVLNERIIGINGPSCVAAGGTYSYTLDPDFSTTQNAWWSNSGAAITVNPTDSKNITIQIPEYMNGSSFTLYSGANFSVSPWYKEYSVLVNVGGCTARLMTGAQPFQSETTISTDDQSIITSIKVIDANGRVVYSQNNVQASGITLGNELSVGVYVVYAVTENATMVTKIFKQ